MRLFVIVAFPLALLVYGHGLEAPLYLDDANVLESAGSFQPSRVLSSRGLGYLSFFLSSELMELFYFLFPWRAASYFRFTNLLIHVLTATLLVGLVRELTGRYASGLASGFLFLVHPVVSQPVMYITQRFELLATLFIVATAMAYARFRKGGHEIWMAGAVLFAILAVLSKETAVILPLWILLLELSFFGGLRWRRRYLLLFPCSALLLLPAWRALRGSGTTLTSVPWTQYFASQGGVLLKYLQLSVFPVEQFLSYGVGPVSAFTWNIVGEWTLVLGVLASGVVLIRLYPVAGFGVVSFFVLLLPVTLLPLPDLIFEHRIYPAFVGLAMAAGALFNRDRPRATVALFVVVLCVYGVRTFERTGEWTDDLAFYEAHQRRFPDHPQVLSAVAVRYYRRGDASRAMEALEQARSNEDSLNAYYSRSLSK